MDDLTDHTVDQLVHRFRHKDLSRARFMAALAGLGMSATGVATLLATTACAAAAPPPRPAPPHHATEHHNKTLHHKHVQRQASVTHGEPRAAGEGVPPEAAVRRAQALRELLDDYADDAVVVDPLFAAPIAGKEAIARRKMAEMASMGGVTMEVVNRVARHDEVVAEWIVRGTHQGPLMGFPGTGRQIEIRGLTVVTRARGKITKESLYYDVADLYRQLG